MHTRLTFAETRTRLLAAMPGLADGGFAPADEVRLREAPAWIAEFGAARDRASLWLWLAPIDVGMPAAMDQAVIDLPEGRYVIETYDIEARTWAARESAQAPPLVVGVPRRAGAIVLRLSLAFVGADFSRPRHASG